MCCADEYRYSFRTEVTGVAAMESATLDGPERIKFEVSECSTISVRYRTQTRGSSGVFYRFLIKLAYGFVNGSAGICME